jgi:spore germination cell wall hydrolase CwlJ-like protein
MFVLASSLFLLAATSAPGALDVMARISDELAPSAAMEPLFPESSADAEIAAMVDVEIPQFIARPVDEPATLSHLVGALEAPHRHVDSNADLLCLARAVYFEARGEPLEGQLAVAQAILNRVDSNHYPSTICGVIRQPGQFTFRHGMPVKAGEAWRQAQAIALVAVEGMWPEIAPDAISFHATYVRPAWKGKVRVAQIGRHIFYR